jgi:hypothetical protein
MPVLLEVSRGFYHFRFPKKDIGRTEIMCAVCASMVPDQPSMSALGTSVAAACFFLCSCKGHPMLKDQRAPRPTIVEELVAALAPHTGGLRRSSVMRAIRKSREAVAREIPLKLEADVERAFRRFCRNDGVRTPGMALFCRPAERAGEVWALDTSCASDGETPSQE